MAKPIIELVQDRLLGDLYHKIIYAYGANTPANTTLSMVFQNQIYSQVKKPICDTQLEDRLQ